MTDETYNGWKNRETWAAALHLNNSAMLQEEAIDRAREDQYGRALEEWITGDVNEGVWADPFTPEYGETTGDMRLMIREIGSLWRVDWQAVRDGLLEP